MLHSDELEYVNPLEAGICDTIHIVFMIKERTNSDVYDSEFFEEMFPRYHTYCDIHILNHTLLCRPPLR